jgi:hypothetical protein
VFASKGQRERRDFKCSAGLALRYHLLWPERGTPKGIAPASVPRQGRVGVRRESLVASIPYVDVRNLSVTNSEERVNTVGSRASRRLSSRNFHHNRSELKISLV